MGTGTNLTSSYRPPVARRFDRLVAPAAGLESTATFACTRNSHTAQYRSGNRENLDVTEQEVPGFRERHLEETGADPQRNETKYDRGE